MLISSEHLVEYVDRLSGLKVSGNESAEMVAVGTARYQMKRAYIAVGPYFNWRARRGSNS